MPRAPPTPVRVTASTRNWVAMSRRVAPSALRTPISRVRWVTLTSMMFMTPTPPTRRAMPAITSIATATPPVICWNCSSWAWLVKRAKSLGWSGRRPRRARRMFVSSSMRAWTSSARLGTVAMWMVSPAAVLDLRELLVEGGDGDGDEVVVAPEDSALVLEDADDLVGDPVDRDDLVDGIAVREERVDHVAADHRHAGAVVDVGVGDEAPVVHEVGVGHGVVGVGAEDQRPVGLLAPGAHRDVAAEQVALLGDRVHQLRQPLQRQRVLDGQVATVALLLGRPAGPAEARLVLLELHEVGAELRERGHHLVVEADHEAHHHDDGGDPRHHPEQGEEAPQLLLAHGGEREADVLAPGRARSRRASRHSVRSASTTGRFDAARAGQ